MILGIGEATLVAGKKRRHAEREERKGKGEITSVDNQEGK